MRCLSTCEQIYASVKGVSIAEATASFSQTKTSQFKDAVAEAVASKICPLGEELQRIEREPGYVETVLREGASRARAIAEVNMKEVKRLVGLSPL